MSRLTSAGGHARFVPLGFGEGGNGVGDIAMPGRLTALALSAVLTLAQVGVPGDAAGREGDVSANKEARPKVLHDHQVHIGRGGYAVQVYFEEGKTFSDPDAHVFYEPLIYLERDENGKLEYELRQDGDSWVLSMYFRVESDWQFLHDAIRKELLSEARRIMPREEFENVDFAYRIKPIHVSSAYFQSTSPRQDGFYVSAPFPSKSFNESGLYNIYFRVDSEDEARSLLSALTPDDPNRRPTDYLRFVYRFSGVSDAVCEARFSGSDSQNVDAKATIEGPGGEGYVNRDNAMAFAEQVARRESMTTRCADAEWADSVVGQLMERLGGIREFDLINGWESLREYNLLDENDLVADLENRARNITKEVVRNQLLDAIAQARSEAEVTASSESAGGSASGEGFGVSGSAAFNTAEYLSEASSELAMEARKEFRDVMEKSGIFGEWEGEKYTPKSLQVYSKEDMHRALNAGITIRDEFPSGVIAEHSIELLGDSHTNHFVENFVGRLESRVDTAVRSMLAASSRARESTAAATRAARSANSAAQSAADAAQRADDAAQSARGAPTRIEVCTFDLELPSRRSMITSFATGVDAPAAFIAGVRTIGNRGYLACGASDVQMVKRNGEAQWYVHHAKRFVTRSGYWRSCSAVAIDVAFVWGDFVRHRMHNVFPTRHRMFEYPAQLRSPAHCDH